MQKAVSLLLLLGILTCHFSLKAQRTLSEAVLTYEVTMNGSVKDKKVPGDNKITYVVTLKGAQSRTEMFSSLGMEATVFDPRSGSGCLIKEYGGTKLLVKASAEQWADHNRAFRELEFSAATGTETLGNYICSKSTAVHSSGKKITVWYDAGIRLPNNDYHLAFSGIAGLPVRFEMDYRGVSYRYDLLSLTTDPISYSRFDVPSKGYRVISYDELKSLNKGQ